MTSLAIELEPVQRRIWEPNPGSQCLFLSCPITEVLLEGTRGGGKTDVLIMDFAQHVGQGYGAAWQGVLFRQTYPQLADVVRKSRRWLRQIFPGARLTGDKDWTFPDGEQLHFRHMRVADEYWNYHGHEYPWIGWEELTTWPTKDCYESMFACNRSSNPDVPRKYRATTNPFGKGHNWVKRHFVDPAPAGHVIQEEREIPQLEGSELVRRKVMLERVRLHSSYLENPKLLAADPMYLANIEKITDPNKRKAWLFGSWDITSGGMFDDIWDAKKHVLEPFPIPPSWRIDRAFDWGSSKPFSVGWWAESDGSPAKLADGTERHFPRGSLFRFAEWYGCEKDSPNVGLKLTASKVAIGIREREQAMKIDTRVRPGPADSSIYDVTDDKSIADNMAAEKVRWLPADKRPGSRKNGWELIRDRLDAGARGDDKPGLYVFSTCRHFIATVPSISRDEDDPDDVDTDAEDHIADETRYRVLGPKPAATTLNMGIAS